MMMSEFVERTGIEPTSEEYAVIEEMYYRFDGDKNAFCKDFLKKNRMIEAQRRVAKDLHAMLDEMHDSLELSQKKIAMATSRIARLEAELEREQEWKPWAPERIVSQKDYDHLRSSGHEMTDDEAKEWIFQEFGFAQQAIRIHRLMNVQEINRHHQLRKVGEIDRRPYYDATDWYYIFFSVRGIEYEAYNGSLNQL